MYAAVKAAAIVMAFQTGGHWTEVITRVWDADDFAMLNMCLTFWFVEDIEKYQVTTEAISIARDVLNPLRGMLDACQMVTARPTPTLGLVAIRDYRLGKYGTGGNAEYGVD
jgi:hypothetical protein